MLTCFPTILEKQKTEEQRRQGEVGEGTGRQGQIQQLPGAPGGGTDSTPETTEDCPSGKGEATCGKGRLQSLPTAPPGSSSRNQSESHSRCELAGSPCLGLSHVPLPPILSHLRKVSKAISCPPGGSDFPRGFNEPHFSQTSPQGTPGA